MTISKKGVANGDPLELIRLCYALNKQRFVNEFDKVKIQIVGEKDLESLAKLCNDKLDISGKIKDGDIVIMFDTVRILDSMDGYTEQEKNSIQQYLVD